MRLGIEHGAQRRFDLIRGQIAQQCCNTAHSTMNFALCLRLIAERGQFADFI
jgi:hypothetical protein